MTRDPLSSGITNADTVTGESLQWLCALSQLPPVEADHVFGRDASNPYYDFLFRLVEATKAKRVLEMGTCTGGSTSYLAAATPECEIISVDCEDRPETTERLAEFPNVRLWIRDTRDPELFADLKHLSPFDILFIDTDHTLEQATFEYATYAPLVRNGGIILFDDIHMNDMTAFWNTITARKIELNHLHCTGFGAVLAESDRS